MKKYLSIVLLLVLMALPVGCRNDNTTNDESSVIETLVVEKTYKAEANEQTAITGDLDLLETENLSAEDKNVRSEIAKYNETFADFKYNK